MNFQEYLRKKKMIIFDKIYNIVYIELMESIKLYMPVFMVLFLVFSCGTTSKTEGRQNAVPEENNITIEESIKQEENYNSDNVSQEYYASTREDVRRFIENLNTVISNKDFNTWKAYLSPEYISVISSPENLNRISESPAMKSQKIVLKTLDDYFYNIVVPSRANVGSRVDNIDIEFISANRVRAFTTVIQTRTGEEQRVILYNLEKTSDVWKIIN